MNVGTQKHQFFKHIRGVDRLQEPDPWTSFPKPEAPLNMLTEPGHVLAKHVLACKRHVDGRSMISAPGFSWDVLKLRALVVAPAVAAVFCFSTLTSFTVAGLALSRRCTTKCAFSSNLSSQMSGSTLYLFITDPSIWPEEDLLYGYYGTSAEHVFQDIWVCTMTLMSNSILPAQRQTKFDGAS